MSGLPLVIIGCMIAVLVVLALGLINLVRSDGGEASARRSNKLMSWRVALQGIAVALLGLMMLLSGKS